MVLRMLCTWCVNGYGVAVHPHCGLVRTSGLCGGKAKIKKGCVCACTCLSCDKHKAYAYVYMLYIHIFTPYEVHI